MAACIAACGHHAHADEEGSHDHETEEAGHEGHGHADQDHGDEIILEPEKARAAGVKVETVKPANFHGVIHTSGKVMATYTSMQKTRSAGGVVVAAPRGGYIKQCLVNGGDYVEAGQPLAIITQNKHLYLRAEVPERRFNELNNIRSAKFSTSYSNRLYDISQMGGHIQSYGRSAEVNNSYIPVIFEFNNTGDVVQGSYADIYLITHERQQVITLPLTAITEEQGLHYIYIQKDAEGYQKQEVTLGESDGERIEIKSGVKAGDRVVTRGAIQVKLASASNAIPAHNHNH